MAVWPAATPNPWASRIWRVGWSWGGWVGGWAEGGGVGLEGWLGPVGWPGQQAGAPATLPKGSTSNLTFLNELNTSMPQRGSRRQQDCHQDWQQQ